ncbi:pseudouridine synthase [Microdochium bolleyi]|uniref:tRNA pseudouridine(55) synthase n=1 Tax=Microdochium bolleyi TaxID=196109 RepID=A0A136J6B1_9PEZI|nr:pseudouridine synthase [Microdochium bolleyi]
MATSSKQFVTDGVFAINKPIGMSSAQVIRDCQHHFNPSSHFKAAMDDMQSAREAESNTKKKRRKMNRMQVKMGHGGTLDPLATGVLILGVGKGTKSLQGFLDCKKVYETVVLFGASTDTYDRVGKVLKKTAYDHITKPMVEEALNSFRGKLDQMPPLYSALKMEGKPLYEYAREGKPIPREIATRQVEVVELELLEWYEPGTHNHRWPADEATSFERSFAEQVWKIGKQQVEGKKRSPEEEEQETKALKAHEDFKRKADEKVDALIYDKPNKRRKPQSNVPLMSGALGDPPPQSPRPGKGSNLIPPSPDPNTPPPWDDKGPPAARIRMKVTSGFYVRSFCHDLGVKVGSAAMMAELARSTQGDFTVGGPTCLEYTDLAEGESVWSPKINAMLADWNSKKRDDGPVQASRAQVQQSNNKQQGQHKRKVSDDATGNGSPKRPRTSQSPSRQRRSQSPSASRMMSTEAVPVDDKKDLEEQSWNGIEDAPEAK